jgi:hypothetical protein
MESPADLTLQLAKDTYYQVLHNLRRALPPPISNTPEDQTRRDNDIINQIASLLPANAEEITLAADNAARDQAAWIEHAAVSLMLEALGRAPPAPLAEPSEPAPQPEPPPRQSEDKFAQLSEAERYATMYPRRAAEIRACGGLPPRVTFDPPPPELVSAIVTGTSPILRQLDNPAKADASATARRA